MARLLDDQKRQLQQPAQGRTAQARNQEAVQTRSAQQQNAQTRKAAQVQQTAGRDSQAGQQHSQGQSQAYTGTPGPGSDVAAQANALLDEKLRGFQGRNSGAIGNLVQQFQNREAFSYDVKADPTYQMLREVWTRDGMMAMEDTMGQAAQLTGGYGNSYAQTAGQQAYQGYMRGLNEMIPELKEAARADYDAETNALLQNYGILMEQDEQEYSRYMDALEQQYQQDRDRIEDERYAQEWAYQQEQDEKDYALNLALAAYEMGDDSLIKALGINPQEYGVSYGSGGGGGYTGGGSGGGSGSGSGEYSGDTGTGGGGGSNVKTPQELGDPFKKEDYTTVFANCAVFAGNGAPSKEIAVYITEALDDGSITQEQYRELMTRFGGLVDSGNRNKGGGGGGSGDIRNKAHD